MTKKQSNEDTFKELCVGYVLNVLEQGERERFEVMLDDATDEQRALYERMRTRANELMFGDEEHVDPDELKERLLAEAGAAEVSDVQQVDEAGDVVEADESGDENRGSFAVVTSIALGIICLSLIFYSFTLWSQLNEQEDTISKQDERIEDLRSEMDELEQMLSVIDSRGLHAVALLGMEANPFGYGNVLWDEQNLRMFVKVGDLPTPSSDMEYQLWAIDDNEATSLHRFSVDSDGEARFFLEGVEELKGQSEFSFAITLESQGNVDSLDGEMYLMGSFGDE
ncbi:MAG: anti-sigma factor domain-containing protein [Bacteroidota bacterium]